MTTPDKPISEWTPEELVRFLAEGGMMCEKLPWLWQDRMWWRYDTEKDIMFPWDPLTDANDRDMLVETLARDKGIFCRVERLVIGGYRSDAVARDLYWPTHIADTPGDAVCIASAMALLAAKHSAKAADESSR